MEPQSSQSPDEASVSPIDEQLVGYLSGELGPEESRQIEQMLSTDPSVRQKLQGLERSWELLDELAPTPVDEAFARSTLEMAALEADRELLEVQAAGSRRRRVLRRAIGLAISLLAGLGIGWLVWPDPERQLLADLPVVERLDEYRSVRDFEFLKLLAEQGLFDEEQVEEWRP